MTPERQGDSDIVTVDLTADERELLAQGMLNGAAHRGGGVPGADVYRGGRGLRQGVMLLRPLVGGDGSESVGNGLQSGGVIVKAASA
jgi:hypothetical protein